MSDQSVSIIVATFNRARYLPECLDSLLAQTVPAHEIVVVDDGSEDATPDIVARYGNRLRYLRKENGGKPSAVNMGLAACSGSLIWLFDDDDVALPDAIEKRLEVLRSAPEAGFVYSPHYLGSEGADGRIVRGQLYIPPQPGQEAFFLEIMKSCFFHLNSALVRREYYTTLGGLDTSMLRGQDYDFQIRLASSAQPAFCPVPAFVFRQHGGIRGEKNIVHDASQRRLVFRRFSLTIGKKLRREVPLDSFLVPRGTRLTNAQTRRAALLNRIHVMANHGCVAEFFDDLRSLLQTLPPQSPLTDAEANALGAALRAGWAYDASTDVWPSFVGHIREIRRLPSGDKAVRALAQGLFVFAKSFPGTVGERAGKLRRAARLAFEAYL